jgi:hypothetical protein
LPKADKNNSKFFSNAVILIDEVDVFFTEDFFANVYTALTIIKDKDISLLIWNIWSLRT